MGNLVKLFIQYTDKVTKIKPTPFKPMKKTFTLTATLFIALSLNVNAEMAERSTFKVIDKNTLKYSSRIDHIFSHDDNNVEIDRYLMLEDYLYKNGLCAKGFSIQERNVVITTPPHDGELQYLVKCN
jgi:hypothetical protein